MTMTADLRDHWRDAGLAGGRVFRDERLQGSPLPAIVIQSVSDPRSAFMSGENALRSTALQIDIWGNSRFEVDQIADAALAARPLRQVIGTTNFRRIYVEDSAGTSERPSAQSASPLGQSTSVYRTRIDLTVWWKPVS